MHLFLLVPNNSGSSILHDLIATSNSVAVLPEEGQFCPKFIGPNPINLNVKHVFTEKEQIFTNVKNYEWAVNKSHWEKLWDDYKKDALIKLEKSPTDILRGDTYKKEFPNCKFIMMIRNPYAVVEGIMRGNPEATIEQAARHAIRVLEIQIENSEKFKNDIVLKYEDLTDNLKLYSEYIMSFLGVADIDYEREFRVKGYMSQIKNMNISQIKRLTTDHLKRINKIFLPKKHVLNLCGYEIIESLDFNFKFIKKIDVTAWKEKLKKFNNDIWNEYTYRQEMFDVHQKTNTVPLIFSEDFESENVKYRPWFSEFADELTLINKELTNTLGFGYVTRAILVKLPSGEIIPDHIDAGESLDIGHRTHIPIITNTDCFFTVGEDTVNMQEGDMWEINNTNKTHSVKNLGNIDRVHLIVDWISINESNSVS